MNTFTFHPKFSSSFFSVKTEADTANPTDPGTASNNRQPPNSYNDTAAPTAMGPTPAKRSTCAAGAKRGSSAMPRRARPKTTSFSPKVCLECGENVVNNVMNNVVKNGKVGLLQVPKMNLGSKKFGIMQFQCEPNQFRRVAKRSGVFVVGQYSNGPSRKPKQTARECSI